MNIIIVEGILPPNVQAYTRANEDGTYTIFINSHLSPERRRSAVAHELSHIMENDFSADMQANFIEKLVRARHSDTPIYKGFQFYYRAI
ncbi:MAG: ImmA/IrrE family metallo-endopeptidase [Negativicoccus succinicivorans]|nr:ImmA/IrrE family metallo-endopeptidase [Negativicoccus succinicivorans]